LSIAPSGWSAFFTGLRVVGCKFLQTIQPLVDLAEIFPHSPELFHELPELRRVPAVVLRPRNTGDKVSPLLGGNHDPLAAEHLQPVPDRHRRDPVLPRQLALGWQLVACLVPAGGDRRPQVIGDLLVRRALAPARGDGHGPTLPSRRLATVIAAASCAPRAIRALLCARAESHSKTGPISNAAPAG
jgi:hypothetical protein